MGTMVSWGLPYQALRGPLDIMVLEDPTMFLEGSTNGKQVEHGSSMLLEL